MITTFEDIVNRYAEGVDQLIIAAGFEDRCTSFLNRLKEASIKVRHCTILDYPKTKLNEPRRSELISCAKSICEDTKIIGMTEYGEIDYNWGEYASCRSVILDVTGLDRVAMFSILKYLEDNHVAFDIAYTEAKEYYPLLKEYREYKRESRDSSFFGYLDKEMKEYAYSYNCEVVQPKAFSGKLEPGKPFMLVAFLAFKRARLQVILQKLEFERKLFLISDPVRNDLRWRKEFMEVANWDLLQRSASEVITVQTLYPQAIANWFEERLYVESRDYARYNVVIAPLGSKMQTLGSYLFWRKHQDVSVVFSHPNSYFPDKFSSGFRDSFVVKYEKWQHNNQLTNK